jgi:hypothetical protein
MDTITPLAREIARAYGGKLRRDELEVPALPACEFVAAHLRRASVDARPCSTLASRRISPGRRL